MSRCINCGGHADLLCDFTLGGVFDGYAEHNGQPYRVQTIDKPPYTRDVPICRSCATFAGNVFFSGLKPGVDTIDYCPLHSAGNQGFPTPITDDEVRSIRRDIVAHYRRKSFYIAPGATT